MGEEQTGLRQGDDGLTATSKRSCSAMVRSPLADARFGEDLGRQMHDPPIIPGSALRMFTVPSR